MMIIMIRVGIRELRENMAATLRQVQSGEAVEITDHGHPVARLVPIRYRSRYEQLVAEGRIVPADDPRGLLEYKPPPLAPGERSISDILAELRAAER
jgi:prevent-host-death family protein